MSLQIKFLTSIRQKKMSERIKGLAEKITHSFTAQNTKKVALYPFKKIQILLKATQQLYKKYPKTSKSIIFISIVCLSSSYLIYSIQDKLIYVPDLGYGRQNYRNPGSMRHPQNRGIESVDLQLKTKDNVTLKGWHLKKNGANKLIVYFQGNAGNTGTRLPFAQKFIEQTNSQMILVACRGYSDSEGVPSQQGLQIDSEAILLKAQQIALQRNLALYIFGTSLGGAVAIYAAGTDQTKRKLSGLVLQNTFTSINDLLPYHLPFFRPVFPIIRLLNRNPWNSLSRIQKVKCPIFFIKSGRDQIIPPQMSDRLRQQCNKCHIHNYLYEIPNGNHNDVYCVNPQSYFNQLNEFFGIAQKH